MNDEWRDEYMNNIKRNIEKSLRAYLSDQYAQYAVLVTGKWGCGKTYFIKNLIPSLNDNIDVQDENIRLKPIYVSLNGVSNVYGLFHAIWNEVYPILNSIGAKVLKLVFSGAIKTVSKCFIDLNGDGTTDDLSGAIDVESFLKLFLNNEKVVGNRILIFDDIERCIIPTEQLFGVLNQFTEHSNCKVILIANEEKLVSKDDGNSQYLQIKEKLIGQTFKFDTEVSDSVKDIVSAANNTIIADNEDLVLDIFNTSNLKNLRSLKTALQSFSVFSALIDSSFKKESDVYNEFIKNVLTYFLICSFELSAGNTDIKDYQGLKNLFSEQTEKKPQDKYSDCLTKHGIFSAHYSIPVPSICQFLSEGYIDNLGATISHNLFYKNATQKDWERLWFHYTLSNDDFLKYVSSVERNIEHGDINNIPTLLHSAGILFSLNKRKLIRISKRKLLSDSKKTANRIIFNAISPQDETLCFSPESAYGKEYAGYKLPEFSELTTYCMREIQKFQNEFEKKICKNIWENLSNENINEVQRLVHRRHEIFGLNGHNDSIFKGVNLVIAAHRITSLNNSSKVELSNVFFAYQGNWNSTEEEIESMRRLSILLRKYANSYKLIEREDINAIATRLEKCASRTASDEKLE